MIELNKDNLAEVLQDNSKVIVQYGATWCGNCRIVKPKFKKLAEENTDVTFLYVDAEKFPESRQHATVENLPTFATFKNGELVQQKFGTKIEAVKEMIDEITGD